MTLYYLNKNFPNEFFVSIANFQSPSIEHNVHLVNCTHLEERNNFEWGARLLCDPQVATTAACQTDITIMWLHPLIQIWFVDSQNATDKDITMATSTSFTVYGFNYLLWHCFLGSLTCFIDWMCQDQLSSWSHRVGVRIKFKSGLL